MALPFHECSIKRFEAMMSPYLKLAKFWSFNGSLSELTHVDDCKVYMNQNEHPLFHFLKRCGRKMRKTLPHSITLKLPTCSRKKKEDFC